MMTWQMNICSLFAQEIQMVSDKKSKICHLLNIFGVPNFETFPTFIQKLKFQYQSTHTHFSTSSHHDLFFVSRMATRFGQPKKAVPQGIWSVPGIPSPMGQWVKARQLAPWSSTALDNVLSPRQVATRRPFPLSFAGSAEATILEATIEVYRCTTFQLGIKRFHFGVMRHHLFFKKKCQAWNAWKKTSRKKTPSIFSHHCLVFLCGFCGIVGFKASDLSQNDPISGKKKGFGKFQFPLPEKNIRKCTPHKANVPQEGVFAGDMYPFWQVFAGSGGCFEGLSNCEWTKPPVKTPKKGWLGITFFSPKMCLV